MKLSLIQINAHFGRNIMKFQSNVATYILTMCNILHEKTTNPRIFKSTQTLILSSTIETHYVCTTQRKQKCANSALVRTGCETIVKGRHSRHQLQQHPVALAMHRTQDCAEKLHVLSRRMATMQFDSSLYALSDTIQSSKQTCIHSVRRVHEHGKFRRRDRTLD